MDDLLKVQVEQLILYEGYCGVESKYEYHCLNCRLISICHVIKDGVDDTKILEIAKRLKENNYNIEQTIFDILL